MSVNKFCFELFLKVVVNGNTCFTENKIHKYTWSTESTLDRLHNEWIGRFSEGRGENGDCLAFCVQLTWFYKVNCKRTRE